MATLDQSKEKLNDVSNGENLFEVPKDGRIDTLPEYFQERSIILIEPIKVVNIGTPESPKIIHPVASLSRQER